MNLIVIFLNSQTTDQLQPLFTSSSTKRKNTRCWHSFLIKCPFLLRLIFPSAPPLLPFFLLTPKKCFNSFHSLCVCCVSPTIFCSIPNSSLSAVRLHPVVHHLSPDGRMSSTRHYFLLLFFSVSFFEELWPQKYSISSYKLLQYILLDPSLLFFHQVLRLIPFIFFSTIHATTTTIHSPPLFFAEW